MVVTVIIIIISIRRKAADTRKSTSLLLPIEMNTKRNHLISQSVACNFIYTDSDRWGPLSFI